MFRVALLMAVLTGCATTTPLPVIYDAPVFHPSFPNPYSVCPITWEVLEVEGKPKVALSYNDNITAAICDKDKDRYIAQLINLTCYYRKETSERICIKEENEQ